MKINEPSESRDQRASKRIAPAQSSVWWRPQFYRTEDAELIAASCHDDQLTVTIANRDANAFSRIAVTAA